jgi:hypothetical protein
LLATLVIFDLYYTLITGFRQCWEICIYQCYAKYAFPITDICFLSIHLARTAKIILLILFIVMLIAGDSYAVGTMAYKDPVAAAAQKYKPIQSAVPGTTLGPIQIEAFLGGGV